MKKNTSKKKVRYAVVGAGYFAQEAVLPAFRNASKNSELSALVSGDPVKLKALGRKYAIAETYSYEEFDRCLESDKVDAVYIALPNSMHRDFAVRAANAGVHVLTEKPMAVTSDECRDMIDAAKRARVKLMVAYRLHFEPTNLKAVQLASSGKLGELRFFSSTFSMQVNDPNIRTRENLGGGPLADLGVYCINAARYLFRAEPEEVFGTQASGKDKRFREVPEMISCVMKFPKDRLATFTCSFGGADTAAYTLVGTKGSVCLDPAYEYAAPLSLEANIGNKTIEHTEPKHDHVAAELFYFSDCVLRNKTPEPDGEEGMADVRVIEAINRSIEAGRPVRVQPVPVRSRPMPEQEIVIPGIEEPGLIHAEPASN